MHNAGADPIQLLGIVPLVDEARAAELRLDIHKKLKAAAKKLSAGERQQLAHQLAGLLPACVRGPEEAAQLLGPEKQVSRQLLHRRYLEQWHYQQPLPLVLTFDHPKGRPAQLIVARAARTPLP